MSNPFLSLTEKNSPADPVVEQDVTSEVEAAPVEDADNQHIAVAKNPLKIMCCILGSMAVVGLLSALFIYNIYEKKVGAQGADMARALAYIKEKEDLIGEKEVLVAGLHKTIEQLNQEAVVGSNVLKDSVTKAAEVQLAMKTAQERYDTMDRSMRDLSVKAGMADNMKKMYEDQATEYKGRITELDRLAKESVLFKESASREMEKLRAQIKVSDNDAAQVKIASSRTQKELDAMTKERDQNLALANKLKAQVTELRTLLAR